MILSGTSPSTELSHWLIVINNIDVTSPSTELSHWLIVINNIDVTSPSTQLSHWLIQHRCQFGPHDAFLESSFNTLGVERLKIQKTLKVLRARKLKGQTRIVNIGYGHRWQENDNKLAKTMVTDAWRMTINWPKRWSQMPGEWQ
jgi:hypothetical protein